MLGIMFLIFFVLLFLGVPIAICLGLTGAVWLVTQESLPNLLLATKIYAQTDSFSMMAIPFFMMAGQIMEHTGITRKLVDFANSIVGHISGGLAHSATVAGMLMAGVSGSGNADTAAIGSIMIPALIDDGYEEGFAVSVMAAAGSLGPVIPPSVCMIIFANAAGYSVGKIFMGGILPGILMGLGFMVVCYFYAKSHGIQGKKFLGWKNVFKTTFSALGALCMPLVIIVGIVSGVFTATEAGVIAVLYGLAYGIFEKKLNFKMLKECLLAAVLSSVGPMMIISYSSIYGYMLTRMGTANIIQEFCTTHIANPAVLLLFLVLVCTIAGCFIDGIATMLMLLPVMTPVVGAMGIDFQHFAIVFVLAILTCQITPPVGSLLYVAAGIKGTPISAVCRHVWPFVLINVLAILLIVFVPELATWIPALIYGA